MLKELKAEVQEFLNEPTEEFEQNDAELDEKLQQNSDESKSVDVESNESDDGAEVEEESLSELDQLKQANDRLREQLNEMSRKVPLTNDKQNEVSSTQSEEQNFFGDWSFDKIIEDEDSFKKFLGEFAGKIKTVTEESLLKRLPGTVQRLTGEQLEARQTVKTFYETHPKLAETKPFVAQITTMVTSEHPDWTLEQVLGETASRAYKALGLKQEATKNSRKPAFAGGASGKRGSYTSEQKSKLEKELEELMDFE